MIFSFVFMLAFVFVYGSSSPAAVLEPNQLTIIIISQPNYINVLQSTNLRDSILEQSHQLEKSPPQIFLTHETFPDIKGAWSLLPIMNEIFRQQKSSSTNKWVIICDDRCQIHLSTLLLNLDSETNNFVGFPLFDRDATITHHFARHMDPTSFHYPLISAGLILSQGLLLRLRNSPTTKPDFAIDASYEFADHLWNKLNQTKLTGVPYLCPYALRQNTECAISDGGFPFCEKTVPLNTIIFAVKTCSKFHEDRLPVIQTTWAKYAEHIRYFSNEGDLAIPTIDVGIENTDRGHCEKTLEILRKVLKETELNNSLSNVEWIVVVDDDTLLSPARLSRLLGCHVNDKELCLGERYGYDLNSESGYNYITGGGGFVLRPSTAQKIIDNCYCPKINSPDDMIIGLCLRHLNIPATHSPLFHQSRPMDYAPETMVRSEVVSFHKFWQIEPQTVYEEWFDKDDRQLLNNVLCIDKNVCTEFNANQINDEL